MFHFLPLAIRYDGSQPAGGHGYQVHVGPMFSDALGSVKITSADPRVKPALRFNYLSTEQDRREWPEAIRCARSILGQPAFAPFDGGEVSPGPEVSTDEEILDWVARDAETALHPSCSCRMGVDDGSVVDPSSMRVHGLDGLRVVDASVMPSITNANLYAPTMMIAEKAADLILGATPLEPSTVRWHRHHAAAASRRWRSAERDQRDAADDERRPDDAARGDALAEYGRREERRDQHAGLPHGGDRRGRRAEQRREHERVRANERTPADRGKGPSGAAQPLVRRAAYGEQEADVPDGRRDHAQLEVDDRVGVLDAVLVDERVRRDARRDREPEGRAGAAAVAVPEAADEEHAEADEADADRLRRLRRLSRAPSRRR